MSSTTSGIGGLVILCVERTGLTPPILNDQAMYNKVGGNFKRHAENSKKLIFISACT